VLSQAIVELGRALRLEMIAEGIETADQADWFRALGIQLGQGFHFARPMPNGEVDRYLRRLISSPPETPDPFESKERPGRLPGAAITEVLRTRKAAG
jgi:predicted signal transduction protein with EAL and GGDEF domain